MFQLNKEIKTHETFATTETDGKTRYYSSMFDHFYYNVAFKNIALQSMYRLQGIPIMWM